MKYFLFENTLKIYFYLHISKQLNNKKMILKINFF
jgi:hypothetical protein